MENNATHFFKMSGLVPLSKNKEFEQTFRFVVNQLSPDCLQYCLSTDIFIAGQYHFYSLWPSAKSLGKFLKSAEYLVLQGAFQTLGLPDENTAGKLIDMKLFENHVNE